MSQYQRIDLGAQITPGERMANKPDGETTSCAEGTVGTPCYCLEAGKAARAADAGQPPFPVKASPDHLGARLGEFVFCASTLAAIDAPAFVLDEHGEVLRFNAKGAILLERDPMAIRRSFAEMFLRGFTDHIWNLTPLRTSPREMNEATEFLAIQRLHVRRSLSADRLGAAAGRWKLTGRQRQVLGLVAHGLTNADIAKMLGIVERTVEFHLSGIFDKAGVDNRATLIARLADFAVTSSGVPAITSQAK